MEVTGAGGLGGAEAAAGSREAEIIRARRAATAQEAPAWEAAAGGAQRSRSSMQKQMTT